MSPPLLGSRYMNVLSLFDGMSCLQIALNRLGIKYDNYYASEIDKYAIQVTQHNYSDTIQLGDITKWKEWNLPEIDLIAGGSPCQGFSRAGRGLNFDDPRSKLYFVFEDIVKHYQPEYWLLENVVMLQEHQDIISRRLGIKPVKINSDLVSAQNRERLYWTNINSEYDLFGNPYCNIQQPGDRRLLIQDIMINDCSTLYHRDITKIPRQKTPNYVALDPNEKGNNSISGRMYYKTSKFGVLSESTVMRILCCEENKVRLPTPVECERLQTVPDNYTLVLGENGKQLVSNGQRYRMLGNGWTTDVICHILSYIN